MKQQYAGSTILFHLPLTCDVTCCATPSLTVELYHSFYPPLRCVYMFVCYTGTNDLRHAFRRDCTQCIYFCVIWDVNFISSEWSLHLWIHCFFWGGGCDPMRVMASSYLRFLDHTQWRTTVGRTPLDKWSAHCRDLYLSAYNTHNRQTSMPPVGFEPTISAGERLQTYALDCAATGTGSILIYVM